MSDLTAYFDGMECSRQKNVMRIMSAQEVLKIKDRAGWLRSEMERLGFREESKLVIKAYITDDSLDSLIDRELKMALAGRKNTTVQTIAVAADAKEKSFFERSFLLIGQRVDKLDPVISSSVLITRHCLSSSDLEWVAVVKNDGRMSYYKTEQCCKKDGSIVQKSVKIKKRDFDTCKEQAMNNPLHYHRCNVIIGGQVYEWEFYKNKLIGLAIARVKFKTRAEAESFRPPSWLSTELTELPQFQVAELFKASRRPKF